MHNILGAFGFRRHKSCSASSWVVTTSSKLLRRTTASSFCVYTNSNDFCDTVLTIMSTINKCCYQKVWMVTLLLYITVISIRCRSNLILCNFHKICTHCICWKNAQLNNVLSATFCSLLLYATHKLWNNPHLFAHRTPLKYIIVLNIWNKHIFLMYIFW